jgi:peroxiredoxin
MRRPKKYLVLIALSVAFLAVLIGFGYSWYSGQSRQELFRAAPQFSLPDIQGQMHSLSELKGRAAIIHFWASWCGPCLEEIPAWVDAAHRFGADRQGPAWIAISLDTSWKEALTIWKFEHKPTHLWSLLDTSQKSAEDFGSYQFPETYLLDAQHRIIHKWVGPQDWSGTWVQELVSKIKSL